MRQKVEKGFLLFEVFLAVAILSLGIIAILQSFSTTLQCAKLSRQYYTALLLLERTMWEFEVMGENGQVPDNEAEGFHCEVEILVLEDEEEEDLDAPPKTSILKEVKVTVSWESKNKQHSVSAVTYIVEREEESTLDAEPLPPL